MALHTRGAGLTARKLRLVELRAAEAKTSVRAAGKKVKTYEVTYMLLSGEACFTFFKLRCPELTIAKLIGGAALYGEISSQGPGGKWTPYGRGSLPATGAYSKRAVREVGEIELAAHGG